MDDPPAPQELDPAERDAVRRLRAALVRPIPAGVAAGHLAAVRRAGRRARRWPGALAVAATLAIAGGAGAFPGDVDLPRPAEARIPATARTAPAGAAGVGTTGHDGQHFPADASEHGREMSDTARTTGLQGREKGEQVSGVAASKSTDRRKDGDHRPATNPVGLAPGSGDGGTPDGAPAGGSGKPDGTPGKGPEGP